MEKNNKNTIFGTDRRVIILGLARMADSLGNSFLIVVLPLYIASKSVGGQFFGLSETFITGIIIGLYGLVTSFSQPFAGRLSDKFGKRKFFVVLGLGIFTLANFSYSLAHSYTLIMVVRALQGFAAAFTITASLALITELSQKSNRGNNVGIYNSFRLIGFGIGPLASGAMVQNGPYNIPVLGSVSGFIMAFGLAALAALISATLVFFFVSDPENTKPSKEKMIIRIRSKEKGRLIDPIFALALATLIMSFGFSLLAPLETQTNDRLSQGPFQFSLEFSALIAALALTQPLIGKASDRFGRRIFIIIGLVGLIPIVFSEGLVTQPWQMITARALHGICAAMVFAPALALAGDLTDEGQTGSQLSVVTMAFGLGISFGSFLSGYAVRFGYMIPFSIASGLAAIGLLIVTTQVPKKADVSD